MAANSIPHLQQIQEFRKEHPFLTFSHRRADSPLRTEAAPLLPPGDEALADAEQLDGPHVEDLYGLPREHFYTAGYFAANEVYQAEPTHNPFLAPEAAGFVQETAPVKVSIPHHVLKATRRTFRPLPRKDFDPQDSMSLQAHLHAGHRPHLRDRLSLQSAPENISWKREWRKDC